MNYCQTSIHGDRSARLILAALRGPDSENYNQKFKFTAPIRLYILGGQNCADAMYDPIVGGPMPTEQDLPPDDHSHFMLHIMWAIREIEAIKIPAYDEVPRE